MKKEFRKQAERIVGKSGINFPFPKNLDFSQMPPIQFIDRYEIDYLHSYGQDSPFFLGLKHRKLLGSICKNCEEWERDYKYATPRASCMYCGKPTKWFELPQVGKIHAVTTCYGGSEAFLKETPFSLILVEFEGIDTLFLTRIKNAPQKLVGVKVEAHFSKNISRKKIPLITDVWFEPR